MDYYRCSGDASFLQERLDDVTAAVDKYDGLPPQWKDIRTPPNCDIWMFFDWDRRIGRSVDVQTAAAFAGKYVQTCRELAEAATSVGRPEIARHATDVAQKHVAKWRELYLAEWANVYDIHALTNLLLGDVLFTAEEQTRAFAKVFADRRTRWTITPYFGSHILTALAKLHRHAEAVEMLHDYWGTMIEAGATSVWEEWDPGVRLLVNGQPPQLGPPATWGSAELDSTGRRRAHAMAVARGCRYRSRIAGLSVRSHRTAYRGACVGQGRCGHTDGPRARFLDRWPGSVRVDRRDARRSEGSERGCANRTGLSIGWPTGSAASHPAGAGDL